MVEAQFEIELKNAIQRMRGTLAPYETFIRSERMRDARSSLSSPGENLAAVRKILGISQDRHRLEQKTRAELRGIVARIK